MEREVFEGVLREFINEEDFAFEIFKDVEITDRKYKADFLVCGVALIYHSTIEEAREMEMYTEEYYNDNAPGDGVYYMAIEKDKEMKGIVNLLKLLIGLGSIDSFNYKVITSDYQPEILT